MLEFLKDYNLSFYYHQGKTNVVAGALHRLSMGILYNVDEEKKGLVKEIHRLDNLGVHLLVSENGGAIVQGVVTSSLSTEMRKNRICETP